MKITSKITAVVLSAVMLLPLAQPLSFAAEKPQIVQYNLIVEDNGMSTHWEDEDGNIVDLYGSSYAPAARRANARSGAYDIPSSYDARTDGAWLVKNSWGDDILLKDGYFWMSYEEPEITDFSYYQASAKSTYDNTYQYDGLGSYSAISYLGRTTIYGANVFTADGHESLNYVGFYNTRTYMSYEINIYKLSSKTDLPTSGTLVSTVKGGEKYYGYHTAKLPEPVEVHEGDVFLVVICINAIYDEKASIATEGTMYDTAFNKYESYISMDGKTWDYVAPDSGYFKTAGNVCLKVMSSNITECKHEYTKTVVPATCTTDGYTLYTCTKCSHSYQSDPVTATGHTPAVDAGYPATCTSVGYTDGSYCSVCK